MGLITWSESYSAEQQVGGEPFYRVQCVNDSGGLTTFPARYTEAEALKLFREVKASFPKYSKFEILMFEPYFHVWRYTGEKG